MEKQKNTPTFVEAISLPHEDTSNIGMLLRLLSSQDQHLHEIAQEAEVMLQAAQGLYLQTLRIKSQQTRRSVASFVLDSLYPGSQAEWELRLLEKPKKVYFKRRKFK